MHPRIPLLIAVLIGTGACGKQPGEARLALGGGGAMASMDGPKFSDAEWTVLRAMAPDTLPAAPVDVSNNFADDDRAAQFGQKLFFDTSFSGRLLDADNDGGPNSLGKKGASGKVSCAGCHLPGSGFADTRSTFQEISLGSGWTHRRTPSLLDIGQAQIVMWGGRYNTLWGQPFGPFENPLEMNSSRLFVAEQVALHYAAQYEAVFGAGSLEGLTSSTRFPAITGDNTGCSLTQDVPRPRALPPDPLYHCHGFPGDQAEYDGLSSDDQALVSRVVVNVGKSLAAYERKLSCGPSRFDAWVNGEAGALTVQEQNGLSTFLEKGKCASCHSGPYLSDQRFHNVGLKVDVTKEGILNGSDSGASVDLAAGMTDVASILGVYSDGNDGRLPQVIDQSFVGAFRTPTLRCLGSRPTYMHTGTMHTLEEVVGFFSAGGSATGFLGTSEVQPTALSSTELMDLVAFLKALDGPGPAPALLATPPI